MAIRTSKKADDITTKDILYYTGPIPFKVVAVNPTLAELKGIGLDYIQNEPQYIIDDKNNEGKKQTIIRFYLENREFTYKNKEGDAIIVPEGELRGFTVDHWISEDNFVGRNSGKTQYVNKYGRTAWAENKEDLEQNQYFLNHDSRPAKVGEENLYKFIFAWGNMIYDTKKDLFDECVIDIEAISKGDFTELKESVVQLKDYGIKILVGLKMVEKEEDIKIYHSTYNKYFLKHNQENTNNFKNHVEKDTNGTFYNAFKVDHYTWEIQCYKQHEALSFRIIPDIDSSQSSGSEDDIPF